MQASECSLILHSNCVAAFVKRQLLAFLRLLIVIIMESRRPRTARLAAAAAVRRMWNPDDVSDDGGESDSSVVRDPPRVHVHAEGDVDDTDEHGSTTTSSSDDDGEEPSQPPLLPVSRARCLSQGNPLRDREGNFWERDPPLQGRRRAADIVREAGGPKEGSRKNSVIATWHLFFTVEILTKILECSQKKLDSLCFENPPQLTMASLKSYIGILYYRGANGDTDIPVTELWGDNYTTFYRTAMSRSLFQLWNRILRFDDPQRRAQLLHTDTFAAFRNIFSALNDRFRMFFSPSSTVTVDEQLVASKCKSPHRVYCPKKPGKYGELIRWLCDSQYNYFLNGNPVTKKPADPEAAVNHQAANKTKALVLRLAEPFLDCGRNITGDRFFSSKELAEELLERRTTYVGTLMFNKRCIPEEIRSQTDRYESKFVFGGANKQVSLQGYQVKKNTKLFMISTMHHNSNVSHDLKKKSDIQLFYNATKSGVDTVDMMCTLYSV